MLGGRGLRGGKWRLRDLGVEGAESITIRVRHYRVTRAYLLVCSGVGTRDEGSRGMSKPQGWRSLGGLPGAGSRGTEDPGCSWGNGVKAAMGVARGRRQRVGPDGGQ